MITLEWNDGLSVGVDSIDDDHKMLLCLISELSDAIENRHVADVIERIFIQLEGYVKLHFTREESLMRRCNYPGLQAHILGHQQFVKKIPELKKELLSADTIEVARDVYLFLADWLLNHIVIEDMAYFQSVYNSGLTNISPPKRSITEKIAAWMGGRLQLRRRIFLTTLFPFIGMFVLGALMLAGDVHEYQAMRQLMAMNQIIPEINELTHSLQVERGLSTGVLSSDHQQFVDELILRRAQTDVALASFKQRLGYLPADQLITDQKQHIALSGEAIAQLSKQRDAVDMSTLGVAEMQSFYSTLIGNLLAITETMALLDMDSDLLKGITALTSIMDLKEVIGLERAMVTQAIAHQELSIPELRTLMSLAGQQLGITEVFLHTASPGQIKSFEELLVEPVVVQANELERQVFEGILKNQLKRVDIQHWFEMISYKVDLLKVLTDKLAVDLEALASNKKNELEVKLYLTALVLLAVIGISMAFSWLLNFSIINPVRRLTYAMTSLAKGSRAVLFTDKFPTDELGSMVSAYEYCRRSLLQADISASIRNQRQGMDLEHNKQEHERYKRLASTDPLTGAVNRRKFIKLAEHEMARVARFTRPLSVLMLDIDYFKKVNDTYGHSCGDRVLKEFYAACVYTSRKTDIIARLGGEEFAIMMPETQLQQACEGAERIRKVIEGLNIEVGNKVISITVSIGVVTWENERYQDFQDMLDGADQALYRAKHSGRNRIEVSAAGVEANIA